LREIVIPEWLRRKEANGDRASRENIRRWQNPEYRAKVAASIKAAWQKPGSKLAAHRGHRNRSRYSHLVEAMRTLRRQGLSYKEIGRRLGCSSKPVMSYAKMGKSVRPLPHISVIQCVRLRRQGLTIARIAHILGCSTCTVHWRLRGRQPQGGA